MNTSDPMVVVDDVRRLTGPNILSRTPLVVVDVICAEPSIDPVLALYLRELGRMRAALGLPPIGDPVVRRSLKGASFGYAAPQDVMLVCAEISEWAANSAAAMIGGAAEAEIEPARATYEAMLTTARNPNMQALVEEAARRDVPFLWDDEDLTVGAGYGSATFALGSAPAVADVEWDAIARIPVALITGTNGKTTSTRLLAHAMRLGNPGKIVGSASSDGVIVGAEVLERGDWSGPAAARRVLRDKMTEIAVLETARGGILRRGLAIADCEVALLTNVSADHLGGYGVHDVTAMAEVKAVVARAARPQGTLVLNARDPYLVRLEGLRAPITYFADLESGDAFAAEVIAKHRDTGGAVVFTHDGWIVAKGRDSQEERALVRVENVPLTFHGAARYNVENALGVVGAAIGMGLTDAAIVDALRTFGGDDNPRRGQLIERRGVCVFLDFGHNPEAVRAAMGVVGKLRARKDASRGALHVVMASPGDRSDADMQAVARVVFDAEPTQVLVRDLPKYLRGREPGDVPQIFQRAFADLGLAREAFSIVDSEVDALKRAFESAQTGDVIVVLVHIDHDDVRALLSAI